MQQPPSESNLDPERATPEIGSPDAAGGQAVVAQGGARVAAVGGQAVRPRRYSSFPALLLVVSVLALVQFIQVGEDVLQLRQTRLLRAQLQPALTKARVVDQTAKAVGCDLLALAPTSVEAAKVVAEFGIQLNTPPSAPK
jgi:hypothetical protein